MKSALFDSNDSDYRCASGDWTRKAYVADQQGECCEESERCRAPEDVIAR